MHELECWVFIPRSSHFCVPRASIFSTKQAKLHMKNRSEVQGSWSFPLESPEYSYYVFLLTNRASTFPSDNPAKDGPGVSIRGLQSQGAPCVRHVPSGANNPLISGVRPPGSLSRTRGHRFLIRPQNKVALFNQFTTLPEC